MPWTIYQSPIGPLTLIGGDAGLREICFPAHRPSVAPDDHDAAGLAHVAEQLDEYFAGDRRVFELDLDLAGSAFRQRVWSAVRRVPYGQRTTYGALARELGVADSEPRVATTGHASAARKVGWAIAATPTPIVVPCHRVVAADGSLTGYLGGLQRKQALLGFEASGGIPTHSVLLRRATAFAGVVARGRGVSKADKQQRQADAQGETSRSCRLSGPEPRGGARSGGASTRAQSRGRSGRTAFWLGESDTATCLPVDSIQPGREVPRRPDHGKSVDHRDPRHGRSGRALSCALMPA